MFSYKYNIAQISFFIFLRNVFKLKILLKSRTSFCKGYIGKEKEKFKILIFEIMLKIKCLKTRKDKDINK